MFLAQILGAVAGNGDLAAAQYELLVTRLARGGLREVVTEKPLLEVHSGHRAARTLARRGPRTRCRRSPLSRCGTPIRASPQLTLEEELVRARARAGTRTRLGQARA